MLIGSKVKWGKGKIPKYASEIKHNKKYTVSNFTVFSINDKLNAFIQLSEHKNSGQWYQLNKFNSVTEGE